MNEHTFARMCLNGFVRMLLLIGVTMWVAACSSPSNYWGKLSQEVGKRV